MSHVFFVSPDPALCGGVTSDQRQVTREDTVPVSYSGFRSLITGYWYLFALLLLPGLFSCTPPSAPERSTPAFVSLAPSVTEILFAVGASEETAAVCSPNDLPPGAKALPVVASHEGVDVERLVSLNPTGCFTIEGMISPEVIGNLRRLGVPVVEYRARTLADLWESMEDIGRRTGHEAEGRELAQKCRARVEAVRMSNQPPPVRTVLVVGLDPLVVSGGGTFLDAILEASGFVNAAPSQGSYPALSLEDLVRAEPDCLILPEGDIPEAACAHLAARLERLMGRPVPLVRIQADLLVRPGPRTPDAVEKLAGARPVPTRSGRGGGDS